MNLDAKLYMIFDILGDTKRTGPVIWKVDRERTEDIKDHIFDLLLMVQILKKYFPDCINYELLNNYIICHDLEEAITGDITAFEGVSKAEKRRVNKIAMDYLIENFSHVLDLETYFNDFESRKNIEAHIAYMLDKVESVICFIKYDSERKIQIDNPEVIEPLRNTPAVIDGKKKGLTVSDIFFEYHMKSVVITDEERKRYGISEEDANQIVNSIKSFMKSLYVEAKNVKNIKSLFPKEATIYNRERNR